MVPQELKSYIAEQIKTGLGLRDIKKILLQAGWSEKNIDEAYQEADVSVSYEKSQEPEYILEGFFPPSSRERMFKRLIIASVFGGISTFLLYLFMR